MIPITKVFPALTRLHFAWHRLRALLPALMSTDVGTFPDQAEAHAAPP